MKTKFTFHVVNLAHTQTVEAYSSCAFTQKVRKFCDMMMSLGHTVYLYASEENEAACTEFITCVSKATQESVGQGRPDLAVDETFDRRLPHWEELNTNAIREIRKRARFDDFICVEAGSCHLPIAQAFPDGPMFVELGIGYENMLSETYCEGVRPFRVFESQAWMHTLYGRYYGAQATRGRSRDRVIPSYFEVDRFPFVEWDDREDYMLFAGRLNDDKGCLLAADITEELGIPLIVAGQGREAENLEARSHVEYMGLVGPERRAELMSHAKGFFCPSLYLEPFGSVAPEAMLCGTPVITTNFGAYPETVEQGVSGYRCDTRADFVAAAEAVYSGALDPKLVREHAVSRFDMEVVKHQYQKYFEDLHSLWERDWQNENHVTLI